MPNMIIEQIQVESEFVRLQLLSFPRSHLAEGLEMVRRRAYITRDGNELPILSVTGVGASLFIGKQIEDTLQIR